MAIKFRRNYKILVDTVNSILTGPALPGSLSAINSLTITPPFTMEFDVIRQNLAEVNTAFISIYGLGLNTRTLLRQDQWETDKYRPLELWAGYGDGTTPALQGINDPNASNAARALFPRIFKGNVIRAYSYRSGTTFITKLECQDAGYGFVNADFNRSYSAGTPNIQIIEDLINAIPKVQVGGIGSFFGTLSRGISLVGNPKDLLADFTGGKFFVDNEKGYCLQNDEYIDTTTPTLISDANGILGVPVKDFTRVKVELIFEPAITVGQRVQLKTSTVPYYNGFYLVKGVSHRGMISPTVCGTATTSLILDNLDPASQPVVQR